MNVARRNQWLKAGVLRVVTILLVVLAAAVALYAQTSAPERGRDENYVVFISQRNGAAELFVLDLNARQVSQLTNTGRGHQGPSISANSRTIVYAARQGAGYELYSGLISNAWRTRRPTVVGANRLTIDLMDEYSPSVTQDGGTMSFASGHGIETMTTNGAGRQVVVPVSGQYNDFNPSISPDGRRIAFASNRSGSYEIWIYTRANGELRQLTGSAAVLGGLNWRSDGKQIVFTTLATSSGQSGIAMADAETGSFRVLTDKNDSSPALSSRGDRLIFTSSRDGDPELYLLNLNTGKLDRLTNSMGVDDSAIFVSEPTYPTRQLP